MNYFKTEGAKLFIKIFKGIFVIIAAGNIFFVFGLKQYLCKAFPKEHEKHKKEGKECWSIEKFN